MGILFSMIRNFLAIFKESKGQSTVEYLLLLAVIAIITIGVLRNDRLQRLIGKDGDLFTQYAQVISYMYRYGSPGKDFPGPGHQSDYQGLDHDTYAGPVTTRFSIPIEEYPNE